MVSVILTIFNLSLLIQPIVICYSLFVKVIMATVVLSSSSGSSGRREQDSSSSGDISSLLGSHPGNGESPERVTSTGDSSSVASPAKKRVSTEAGPSGAERQPSGNEGPDDEEVVVDRSDEGDRLDLPVVAGYDWAPHEPRDFATRFRWGNDLERLVERVYFFKSEVPQGSVVLRVCAGNERVCHGPEGVDYDFFYAYSCFFQDLGVRLPFHEWQSDVLREI